MEVGEAVFERVAAKVVKEGGPETLERVSQLAARHGPDIIRALDNSPAVAPVVRALNNLPAEQIPKAAVRLAAGSQGRALAETTLRHGASALRAEMAHPGIGGRFVRVLGNDGASLCGRLTTDQAIAIGRHVDDIAVLPPAQRGQLLELMSTQTDRFVQFVGRFVENNPGTVLFTTATTGVVLANAERVLGGDHILFDDNGNPVIVSKPGLIQRGTEPIADATGKGLLWLWRGVSMVLVGFLAAFAGIKLWGAWKREQISMLGQPVREPSKN